MQAVQSIWLVLTGETPSPPLARAAPTQGKPLPQDRGSRRQPPAVRRASGPASQSTRPQGAAHEKPHGLRSGRAVVTDTGRYPGLVAPASTPSMSASATASATKAIVSRGPGARLVHLDASLTHGLAIELVYGLIGGG